MLPTVLSSFCTFTDYGTDYETLKHHKINMYLSVKTPKLRLSTSRASKIPSMPTDSSTIPIHQHPQTAKGHQDIPGIHIVRHSTEKRSVVFQRNSRRTGRTPQGISSLSLATQREQGCNYTFWHLMLRA